MSFEEWLLKEHGVMWEDMQADLLQQGFEMYHIKYEKTKLYDEYQEYCKENNFNKA